MSDLDPAIWAPVPIAPLHMLSALRGAVLARATKRMPKWKFRVADDVVVQMQPRPATRTKVNRDGLPWFDCLAVVREGVAGAMLKDPPRDSWKIQFRLTIFPDRTKRNDATWRFKTTGIGFGGGLQTDACLTVRNRLIGIIPLALEMLRPEMMVQHSCLFCGRPLTDPVSMARWIGPECAGTAAAITPFVVNLAA